MASTTDVTAAGSVVRHLDRHTQSARQFASPLKAHHLVGHGRAPLDSDIDDMMAVRPLRGTQALRRIGRGLSPAQWSQWVSAIVQPLRFRNTGATWAAVQEGVEHEL